MADIRCSHCGKENPDFLDFCQFCQTPLKSESTLHIGEKPTKKNTGELENILPDWLKDARKQARDSAEEDAVQAAAQPKVQKDEPVDLLAGLFQSESKDDEDVPDWLAAINPTTKSNPVAPKPAEPEPETDFFAQFNKSEPAPVERAAPSNEPAQSAPASADRDELSDWFIQATERPAEPLNADQDAGHADWGVKDPFSLRGDEAPAPKEPEDLSWLHNLESASKHTDELKPLKETPDWSKEFSTPSQTSGEDDLSWLNQLGAIPAPEKSAPQPSQPSQPGEDLSWLDNLGGTPTSATPAASDDDLSWLSKLGGTPVEPPAPKPEKPEEDLSWLNAFSETPQTPQVAPIPTSSQEDLSWLNDLGGTPEPRPPQSEKSQEDLSWLNAFSDAPETLQQPSVIQPSSQEDLSWLNNLGGTTPETPASEPEKTQEDLSWLNVFSDAPQSSQPAPTPSTSQDDLSWLSSLGGTPSEPASSEPEKPQEDLSWLNAFGSSSEPAPSTQPSSTDDLSWLNNLQGESGTLSSAPFSEPLPDENAETPDVPYVSPFMPRKTAPLDEGAEASIPDWLKSATEEPSMPMGSGALDQLREDYRIPSKPEEPFSWKSFTQEAKPADQQPGPAQPEPAFFDESLFNSATESSAPSTDDVNSLFSIGMPDWLSQAEPARENPAAQDIGIHAEGGEALSPVDLPSWVQAMRPVDAVISENAPSIDDQPTERDGPLAGLRGVLPAAPVGSARRPRPLSLKLQASDEQQTSAALLEQLLAGETTPRSLASAPALTNQRALRWALAALFILVLGSMIFLRSQMFATSAFLPVAASDVTSALQGIPDRSNVLVVMDYEPALAGELEAVSGPLLDQLALLRHPTLSFIAMSPNGVALSERLMSQTGLSSPNGLGYSAGQNYFNMGYLSGSEAGVLTFVQSPRVAVPAAEVNSFADYSAVILLTDNAESARIWIEQLQNVKQSNSALTLQPLVVAASAQAGPLLQPYVLSRQINGMVTGLSDASRLEFVNNSRPGIARSYWDAFGVGLLMAVALIVLGSLWSFIAGIRARRAEAAEG